MEDDGTVVEKYKLLIADQTGTRIAQILMQKESEKAL